MTSHIDDYGQELAFNQQQHFVRCALRNDAEYSGMRLCFYCIRQTDRSWRYMW